MKVYCDKQSGLSTERLQRMTTLSIFVLLLLLAHLTIQEICDITTVYSSPCIRL